jgi:N-acetylglutamate synthase-like GNAT family acetyltransferase
MESLIIREIKESDKEWVRKVIVDSWGSEIVIGSKPFNAPKLPGFIGEIDGRAAGVLTYNIDENKLEIVSLDSTIEKKGIGSALIEKAREIAKEKNLESVFLVTSNDNVDTLKFYQKRGFRIIKVYPNAIDEARKIKPNIPQIGEYGIPLKDALELEYKI